MFLHIQKCLKVQWLIIIKIIKKDYKKAPERYQSLFKVKKEKKQKYDYQSYKDRTEDEKQKACWAHKNIL